MTSAQVSFQMTVAPGTIYPHSIKDPKWESPTSAQATQRTTENNKLLFKAQNLGGGVSIYYNR